MNSSQSLKFSVRALCLGDDIRQILPQAQALGFDGVELDLMVGLLNLAELSISGRREIRHLLARHDLALSGLRLSLEPQWLTTPARYDRALWMIRRGIEAAAGLQAMLVCLELGRLPGVNEPTAPRPPIPAQSAGLIIVPDPSPVEPVPAPAVPAEELSLWDGVDSILTEAGQLADRTDVTIALSSELSSFASLLRALRGCVCPWFGVDLDPLGILRDRWPAEKIIDETGPLIRHLRGRDATVGSDRRTQPAAIGAGSTDWPLLLATLDQGGYHGWATVDTLDLPNRSAEASGALGRLRETSRRI